MPDTTIKAQQITDEEVRKTHAPCQRECKAQKKEYIFVKRVFDIVVSVLGGVLLLVPMLMIAAVIKLESPGPAIFRQVRIGKDGIPFVILKFRTMYLDSPSERPSREFLDADRFITKTGKFLRRTSLDELPQLWNILRGEMSFVGYRPVCITETQLNELRTAYGVFSVLPGLTGLAQVSGRDTLDYQTKAELDAKYVRNCGVKLDVWCLLKTITVVLNGEGVR